MNDKIDFDKYDTTKCEPALLYRNNEYLKSGLSDPVLPANAYKSMTELLHILKQASAPLYLFDEIIEWVQRSYYEYSFDFNISQCPKREVFVTQLKDQFDFKYIEPTIYKYQLPGSKNEVDIIAHDFLSSFYTLLNDSLLMQKENLLIDFNDPFKEPDKLHKSSHIDDIDTGEVWRMGYKRYCKKENNEILCPIIFFIDKTHTDKNGRLCIEQIRFTLGIFNRETRNNSKIGRAHV